MNEESVLVYGERSLNEAKIEPGLILSIEEEML